MVRKALGIGVIGALAALMVVSLAMAQPGGGGAGGGGAAGGGGGGGGRGGGGMRGMMDPATMATNLLETLGITGDAAKAVQPKLEKVITLNMQVTVRGGFGRGGGRMGGGGGGGAAAAPETEVSKARAALQALLPPDNTTAKPEDITKALTAFRAAREKAKQELATAQAELKKVLTPAQEAQLVVMGQLE